MSNKVSEAQNTSGDNYFDGMQKLGKSHKHFLRIAAVCYPVAWGECGHMKEIISEEYNIQLEVILDSTNMSMHKELIMDRTAFGFATELIIHGASYDASDYKVIPIKENVKLETYLMKRKDVDLAKAQQIVVDELRSAIKLL